MPLLRTVVLLCGAAQSGALLRAPLAQRPHLVRRSYPTAVARVAAVDESQPPPDPKALRAERRAWRRDVRRDVLVFAGPALSTVLADPLMSVVDGVCCGRFASTLQLASLGPALAVFNFINYFFFFLNAATTVLVSQALARDDEAEASNTLSNAMLVGGVCGLALTGALWRYAEGLVALTGCVPELIAPAARYLRVRGLGQPIVLSSLVLQCGLLAQQDSVTPLQAIAAAFALNVVGDVMLVPTLGAVGAAWATLWSQLGLLPLLVGLSIARKRLPLRLQLPRPRELRPLFSTAAPLLGFEVGLNLCFGRLQTLGTQFSVASAAAFQAFWTPVAVLGFATFPLKQAGQVFLPRLLSSDDKLVGGQPKVREFLKVIATLSAGCGLLLAGCALALARKPALLTTNAAIWPLISSFGPYAAVVLLVLGSAQALEGVCLGVGDLSYLSYSQLANVATVMLGVVATRSAGMGVHGAWLVFIAFASVRFSQALFRLLVTRRPWKLGAEQPAPAPATY